MAPSCPFGHLIKKNSVNLVKVTEKSYIFKTEKSFISKYRSDSDYYVKFFYLKVSGFDIIRWLYKS